MRIAMWSGPRNISTAMMRSFGNRRDTAVWDEPFYATYLRATGIDHPGRENTLQAAPESPEQIIERLTGPIPGGCAVFYQKHMAHHMVDAINLDWLDDVTNCFLIRQPREVILSFSRVIPDPSMRDVGFEHQAALFDRVRERTGRTPPVIDARDVLENPRHVLSQFCDAVGLPFDEDMLQWPAGPRDTDGPWAPHWYDRVERSTGFAPYQQRNGSIPEHLQPLLAACEVRYEQLHAVRLR